MQCLLDLKADPLLPNGNFLNENCIRTFERGSLDISTEQNGHICRILAMQ